MSAQFYYHLDYILKLDRCLKNAADLAKNLHELSAIKDIEPNPGAKKLLKEMKVDINQALGYIEELSKAIK